MEEYNIHATVHCNTAVAVKQHKTPSQKSRGAAIDLWLPTISLLRTYGSITYVRVKALVVIERVKPFFLDCYWCSEQKILWSLFCITYLLEASLLLSALQAI